MYTFYYPQSAIQHQGDLLGGVAMGRRGWGELGWEVGTDVLMNETSN